MKGDNEHWSIQLFSHLIQTILYCRLNQKVNTQKQITLIIDKLESRLSSNRLDLNFGVQMISKLHQGSDFKIQELLKKHFLDHQQEKYQIEVQIFSLQNKRLQQYFPHISGKNEADQKWIFRKQKPTRRAFELQSIQQSDLLIKVLDWIREQLKQHQQETSRQINYNTTANKGYQIAIKSKCNKKQKFVTHVFNHDPNYSQPYAHQRYMKTSLIDLSKYWEKSIFTILSVGCYSRRNINQQPLSKVQSTVEIVSFKNPDRKSSSETKAEEKEKQSNSSFKFSLQNFPFRLSTNKDLKHSSSQIPVKKKPVEIINQHRPRYQSIYQARDEQMDVFILSPRKLSQEQSPRAGTLEQKPIKFQITDKRCRGFSEEVIQQFNLQPNENMSDESSDEFEMLQENDQVDSTNKKKSLQKMNSKRKQFQQLINALEKQVIQFIKKIDGCSTLI